MNQIFGRLKATHCLKKYDLKVGHRGGVRFTPYKFVEDWGWIEAAVSLIGLTRNTLKVSEFIMYIQIHMDTDAHGYRCT